MMRGPFQSPNFRGNYADSTSRQAFFFLWFITSKSTVSSASNLINLMNVLALQPKLKKSFCYTFSLIVQASCVIANDKNKFLQTKKKSYSSTYQGFQIPKLMIFSSIMVLSGQNRNLFYECLISS